MDKTAISSLIFEWQGTVQRRQGIERELESRLLAAIGSRPIKIVTGFRRSGKSFLVQQVAKRLLDNAVILPANLLYLNLEDFRLMEITTPERLNQVYELFLSVSAQPGKKLLIFDEIQNVANWDRFIRTIYERDGDEVEIILTGSNSELLSSELGSNLAGRFIEFFLHPFSFREYLAWHRISVASAAEFQRNRREIMAGFHDFLTFGGLPELFTISDNDARLSYLSGILSKVILDDVVRRFRVDNVTLLEKVFQYLMANAGNVTTFASLTRHAKVLGIPAKNETVIAYCSYFVKAFALFEASRFSWKQNRVFSDTRKYYSIDTGLITLYRPMADNLGVRLEQCVYLELMRRGKIPMFATNDAGRELDFVIPDDDRGYDKYQVTTALTPEDEKRELGAFSSADPWLQGGKNLLLSLDDDETPRQWQGVTIPRRNLARWLLGL
jgi:hypothetical protein